MRIIRNLFIGVLALLALAVAVAYALPRHVIVERDIVIDAPPEAVFPHVNSLQAFQQWSPWNHHDPDMTVAYSGPETGVGAVMEWSSDHPQVGNGRQEITASTDNAEVRTSIAFEGMGDAEAWWVLTPQGDATRVTWGLDSDMGMNPIGRWVGLFLDGMVGADYERGLAQLRTTVDG
jgi:carbon monoxide dehydrogenase subunit G